MIMHYDRYDYNKSDKPVITFKLGKRTQLSQSVSYYHAEQSLGVKYCTRPHQFILRYTTKPKNQNIIIAFIECSSYIIIVCSIQFN